MSRRDKFPHVSRLARLKAIRMALLNVQTKHATQAMRAALQDTEREIASEEAERLAR